MHNELDAIREKLQTGGYTCVVRLGAEEYCSFERGVKPLLTLLQTKGALNGSIAADKTVGAGAAHLYVLLGVDAVWANVISEAALKILKEHDIAVFYGELVPHIINRQGDGICPIERSVKDVNNSQEAYVCIIDTLQKLVNKA